MAARSGTLPVPKTLKCRTCNLSVLDTGDNLTLDYSEWLEQCRWLNPGTLGKYDMPEPVECPRLKSSGVWGRTVWLKGVQ
jgi:hypothetical protein